MSQAATISWAIPAIFFVSGAAGLIFEITWFYRCSLVFGSSVTAVSIVLSSFMGGLAAGNALCGWYARIQRQRRPLVVYATLEAIVAVTGVALTYALPALTGLFAGVVGTHADRGWMVNLLRFVTVFSILVVPTTAMGATLPLIVGGLSRRRHDFGVVLGRLYGWNTIGAVAGVISAEMVFIDRFGVAGTGWIAGALATAAALAALSLSGHLTVTLAQETADTGVPRSPRAMLGASFGASFGTSFGASWRLLLAAFLTGGCLLALEVVWFRFLTMYVLMTTLALSLMLAVVLSAIGAGALVASWWLGRHPDAWKYLPAVAFVAGCLLVASYEGFQSLTGGTQIDDWRRILWLACVLTLPTSVVSAATFTLIGQSLQRLISDETRSAAWLTFANTVGAMCGTPVAAFLFLPKAGMERTFFLLVVIYGIVGILTLGASGPTSVPIRRVALVLPGVAWIAALATFPFGLMQNAYFARAAGPYTEDGSAVVATREGPSETIFLMQQRWLGKPVYSRLVTNGFSMSGTAVPALRYMRYFVYLPMLLHDAPLRRVLVVCYGVGVTADAATQVSAAESIDVVEISRDIVAMSDLIWGRDENPLHRARVRLHVEDGRFFLETTKQRFDLITGEPPPPRTPGAVNIYTRDYFRLVYDRLAEGGMATYWLPVGRPDPGTDVNTIIRAFCDIFDDCSLWNATPFDFVLLGTRHARGPVPENEFVKAWRTPSLGGHLREVGFELPEQIGATFLGDATYLRELTANTPPLTDDFPQRLRPTVDRASLSDPRYRSDRNVAELYERVIDPERARRAFAASGFIRKMMAQSMIDRTVPFFEAQRMINRVLWEGGKPLHLIEDLHTALTQTSLQTLPLWMLGSDDVKERIGSNGIDAGGLAEYMRGLQQLVSRDYAAAARRFARAEAQGFRGITVRPLLAYSLCLAGRPEMTARVSERIRPTSADEEHFLRWLGTACRSAAPPAG